MLIQYDVCLTEIKTGLPVMIRGYVPYRSAVVVTLNKGSVVVGVKGCIAHLVQSVDIIVKKLDVVFI